MKKKTEKQVALTSREYKELACNPKGEEALDTVGDGEIVVHWVNKYGMPVTIKTRKGGTIHRLWQAEHERRSRKRIEEGQARFENITKPPDLKQEQPRIVDIETEICQEPLPEDDQSSR